MNSGRVIQSPLIQTIFRRLSSSDSRSLVNNANSPCVLTKINDIEKNVNSNTSPTHQRFFTTLNSQPIPLHRTMDSKPSTSSKMSGASSHKTNRLSLEKSPYLRQHMHNPVDWYPWSDEAFERARKENKLIFLSVGYSTCHWCHVMEKESFENDTVAEIMNKHFINVKVDREERPDIDKVYMTFIQATTFRGGWPMSVFLTPDLKPITGGTYFPPEDTRHQIGFKTLLLNIAKAWNENQDSVIKAGESSTKLLEKSLESDLKSGTSQEIDVPSLESMHKCFQQYAHSYESEFGGFNDSPKFPQPSNFNFLFHVYVKDKESDMGRISYEMCIHTLRKMAKGGIYDHIGDGFARYSVDNKWHVPHFEKMLYDQGQLVISYCDAFLVTKDEFFANVVRGILKYVLRDLSHDLGGFYSAEDADSLPKHTSEHKMEGAFYVWEYNEIKNVLADRKFGDITYTVLFAHHYNIAPGGNVDKMQDPHGELLNKNVLIVFGSIEKTASHFKINAADVRRILKESRDLLYEVRNQRPRPHLDSKIITAWNGLMISGCSKAGHVLKDQSYINRAILCANFIKKFLYNEGTKTLLRSCYRGSDGQIEQISVPISGFLDDYAFLIRGLLDLYEASLDADWLQWAETLQEQQDRLFWDSNSGGYFHSASDSRNVIMRLKEDQDGAEPSGNSVSVQNLLRIAAYLDRSDLKSKAGRILTAFSYRLCKIPMALPEMVSALISYHDAPTQVFIAGSKDDPQTTALLDVVRERLLPGRLLAVTDGPRGSSGMLYQRLELVSRLQPLGGRPTAYVCRHYACSLPVTEPNELADLLDNNDRND